MGDVESKLCLQSITDEAALAVLLGLLRLLTADLAAGYRTPVVKSTSTRVVWRVICRCLRQVVL
jgi:hypothetical protein